MYCSPKKGSKEHAEVKAIYEKNKPPKAPRKTRSKKIEPAVAPKPEQPSKMKSKIQELLEARRDKKAEEPKAPVKGEAQKKLEALRARNAKLAEIKEKVKKTLAKKRIGKAVKGAIEARRTEKAQYAELLKQEAEKQETAFKYKARLEDFENRLTASMKKTQRYVNDLLYPVTKDRGVKNLPQALKELKSIVSEFQTLEMEKHDVKDKFYLPTAEQHLEKLRNLVTQAKVLMA
jgi:hypothetical protein